MSEARIVLGELIGMGLAVERQTQKTGNLLYKITATGAALLQKTISDQVAS